MSAKIPVSGSVVEIQGDEINATVWKHVKESLILPFLDIPLESYDLSLENRIKTQDEVTLQAVEAIKKHNVGIKCATMEISDALVKEKQLKGQWKTATVFDRERTLRPAASTLRSYMEGSNFRSPILASNIPRTVSNWKKPIVIARHVFGDQYRATDIVVEKRSKYQIVITPEDGSKARSYDVCDFTDSGGVALAMYNTEEKIIGFAHSCFKHALDIKYPVYLSAKDAMLREYDGAFVRIFSEIFDKDYKAKFDKAGIWFSHMSIDKMVAFALSSEGGFIWALKNYDGDVQSEMVAQGFGAADLMTSVVLGADGKTLLAESARSATTGGTSMHRGQPAINPMMDIFAWIRGLQHRAKLDDNAKLADFANKLETASVETVERGKVTKDLVVAGAGGTSGDGSPLGGGFLNSKEMVDCIAEVLQEKVMAGTAVMYTLTDEAPMLATYALLPIVRAFTQKAGINVELRDISVAGRVVASFQDRLPESLRQDDELAALGELAKSPAANIVKLPNISASIPQLKGCIAELQGKGYTLPNYPDEPKNDEEREIKAKYAKVLGSAVNPVLREGNSDRRAAVPVKNYAKKYPHSMGKWSPDSKTHVSHMSDGDFYASEKSHVVSDATEVRIELAASDGTTTVLKPKTTLLPGEVIDASFMSKRRLRAFYKAQIEDAKKKDVLLSLHLKATMMKISDPILFGHMVCEYFDEVFQKHGPTLERLGANPNNGWGDIVSKVATLPEPERSTIEGDIQAVFKSQPELAMVDSDKGITNLHVPSDIIIDASMPAMIRSSGQMWTPGNKVKDCKAIIPDRCYAGVFDVVIEDCRKNGAFNPSTMGSVPNVGLMAQKAEEYGSHDKTFEVQKAGTIRVVDSRSGQVLLSHAVEEGDVWRMCQTKDIPIQDWVKLAVARGRATGAKVIFWLDEKRAHDTNIIEKVKKYLPQHDTSGLDIEILPPTEACRISVERARKGMDSISVTGNVLRDYNTDLFPILELGTSAKMLSIVPMIAGGGMYETGAGGSAPKHVQQFVEENHLRWDSLGEYLALAVSLEDLAAKTKNPKAKILAECLDKANEKFLDANKNPGRKCGQLDNRGSHFYLAMYWAQALSEQNEDQAIRNQFTRIRAELEANESIIIDDMISCQGRPVDMGGYFQPDPEKVRSAMCPSAVFNAILTLGATW
jgi:isocitrate dehydrogenase